MNIQLLKKIRRQILRTPRKFDMRFLHTSFESKEPVDFYTRCGTAHCICGWAAVLMEDDQIQNGVHGLGVFDITEKQGFSLFFTRSWPRKFRDAYENAPSYTAKAKFAAARIDHFIATGK